MLNITTDFSRQYPTVILQGRFDAEGANAFEKQFPLLLQKGNHWIIDLRQVDFITSSALHSLIKLYNQLDRKQGFFILAGLQKKLREILQISGLADYFLLAPSTDEAVDILRTAINEQETGLEYRTANGIYQTQKISQGKALLVFIKADEAKDLPDALIPLELQELNLTIGFGGIACNRKEAWRKIGLLMTYGYLAGVNPASGQLNSDIVLVTPDASFNCYALWAAGVKGNPVLKFRLGQRRSIMLGEFLTDIFDILRQKSLTANLPAAVAISGEIVDLQAQCYTSIKNLKADAPSSFSPFADIQGLIAFAVIASDNALKLFPPDLVQRIKQNALSDGNYFYALGITFSHTGLLTEADVLKESRQIGIYLDSLQDVVLLKPDTVLRNPQALLYLPQSMMRGDELLSKVEIEPPEALRCEWETIIRRIYSDAKEIILHRLPDDDSVNLFMVKSAGADSAVSAPSLLKITTRDYIKTEEKAYRNYVEKLIPQGGVSLISTAIQGAYGGLAYRLCGVVPANFQLKSLYQLHQQKPADFTIQALHRLFTQTFKQWYNHPILKNLRLYWEHHPLRTNKNLLDIAKEELKISPEAKTIPCKELDAALSNPFYFLNNEFPRRILQYRRWFTALSLGNLNLKKILVDEAGNLFCTDFHQVKVRNIVNDFAYLEASLVLETNRLKDNQDLKHLARFAQVLLQTSSLEAVPLFSYSGSDVQVEKNYKIICLLRQYADKVTIFENDIAPYYLVMLEYMLNAAVRPDLTIRQKQLALICAALLTQKITELE